MKRSLQGVMLASLIAISPLSAAQPAEAIKFYRETLAKVSNNYRNHLRPHLSAREKDIVNEIRFELDPSQNLYAHAYIDKNGTRKIGVSLGWMLLMQSLMMSYWAPKEENRQCYLDYLRTIAELVVRNTQVGREGGRLKMVPFFPYYVRAGAPTCKDLTEEDLVGKETSELTARSMDAALVWLLGHEVAHHVLGHVDRGPPATLALSRKYEAAADHWSITHAFDIRVNPSPAKPVLLFYSLTGITDHEEELRSTHPASIRRFADFLDVLASWYRDPEAYERKFSMRPPPEWIEEIDSERRLVRSLFK